MEIKNPFFLRHAPGTAKSTTNTACRRKDTASNDRRNRLDKKNDKKNGKNLAVPKNRVTFAPLFGIKPTSKFGM